jgi:hypothetical protein
MACSRVAELLAELNADMLNRYAVPVVRNTPIKAKGRKWDILTDIPYVRVGAALVFGLVVLVSLVQSLTIGAENQFRLPLLTTVISGIAILVVDYRETYKTTYMRIGFHAGLLIFINAYPILSPDSFKSFDENARFTAGMVLLLCVIGFEVSYWAVRTLAGKPIPKAPFVLKANNYGWVSKLMTVGIILFALFLVYLVATSGRSITSLFFLLRGNLAINQDEAVMIADDTKNKVAFLFSYGRFLAAAAAAVLILAPNPYHFRVNKLLAWFVLGMNAFFGLNIGSGGSRSVFMLSAVPLLTTAWIYAGTYEKIRQLRPVFACVLLFFTYFGVQYLGLMRDQGTVQEDEVGFDIGNVDISETKTLSAFHIYSDYEKVIAGFPDKEPFQNGASIVPIVLGWVPRRYWPDKPYPFTHVANSICGFDVTTVSIACGFPAEGYGNFGYVGALLWGALFGIAAAFADYRLSNLRPGHPLALPMRGMMAVWAAILVRGGTAEMFYTGVFPIGFMWICLYFSDPRDPQPE